VAPGRQRAGDAFRDREGTAASLSRSRSNAVPASSPRRRRWYECVFAFIREDYTSDLKKISVPVLVMHGDADQIVPYATAAPRAVDCYRTAL
jgi:pimeloyl-ACP methyl ester carboxylesterase